MRPYSFEVDMWSLGVIIYQLVHNDELPFEDKHDQKQTILNTVDVRYNLNRGLPKNIKKLIKMLLVRDGSRRAKP